MGEVVKTFFMETTQIAPEKTLAEIEAILVQHNAKQVLKDYDAGKVVAVSFMLDIDGSHIPFRLPCRWQEMRAKFQALRKRPKGGDTMDDWARRVAWRQVLRWVEAQMALIETGMVKVQEVFLPYAQIGPNGQTMYEAIQDRKFNAAIADRIPQ